MVAAPRQNAALLTCLALTGAFGWVFISPAIAVFAAIVATWVSVASVWRGEVAALEVEVRTIRDELQRHTDEQLEQKRHAEAQHVLLEEKNRELERVNQTRSQFLASVSHELRTPLNAIIGFAELLHEGVAGKLTTRQVEYIDDIDGAGRHLLTVINDILDLSKIEAGKMELRLETIFPATPVHEALEMVASIAQRKGVRCSVSLDEDVTVCADPRRLRQVVLNLLSNAVKFTPSGGAVNVTLARARPGCVELRVIDTGIGIAHENHDLIFEAFEQVDAETSREFEGTGLGLALVKRLLAPMNASVRVESELGHGATFVVEFHEVEQPARLVKPSLTTEGIDVVVADDDAATRTLLERVLRANRMDVRVCANGHRVMEALAERMPKVLVLDLMMPELDGYEVLSRLRAMPGGAAVKVLVFCASPPDETRSQFFDGVRTVLKGSMATTELVSLITRMAQVEAPHLRSAA